MCLYVREIADGEGRRLQKVLRHDANRIKVRRAQVVLGSAGRRTGGKKGLSLPPGACRRAPRSAGPRPPSGASLSPWRRAVQAAIQAAGPGSGSLCQPPLAGADTPTWTVAPQQPGTHGEGDSPLASESGGRYTLHAHRMGGRAERLRGELRREAPKRPSEPRAVSEPAGGLRLRSRTQPSGWRKPNSQEDYLITA